MAGSVNKVILIGNLGRDPEVRHGQDGSKIVTMNIATSERWRDRSSNEMREKTEWHRVVIFNPNIADVAEKYVKKGAKVYIEGALQTRKWNDPTSGQEKFTTEIIVGRFKGELTMLDGRGDGGGSDGGGYSPAPAQASQSPTASGSGAGWQPPADLDDEIPF